MSTAQKILVIYGTLSIAYGMALGLPLSRIRAAEPTAPRHLVTAHLSALMQGTMHLALAVAAGFASLDSWLLTTAAISLVGGSSLFVGGVTANWLMRIGDHFAERSQGYYLLAASGPLHLAGIAVVFAGVALATVA